MTRCVFIVDDDQLLVRAMTRILKRMGWDSCAANNALEAREILRKRGDDFDVALVDLGLGREHGSVVARMIWSEQPDLPVVMMSGSSPIEYEAVLRGLPVAGFLTKPFEPSLMDTMLTNASRTVSVRSAG